MNDEALLLFDEPRTLFNPLAYSPTALYKRGIPDYMDGAAHFSSADKEYLQISDNTTISATTTLELGVWIYLDSVGATRIFLQKGTNVAAAANLEYSLFYSSAATNFRFSVSNGSTITSVTDTGTAPSTGTWYFIRCGRKSDGTLFIQRNNATEITQASAVLIQDANNPLYFGYDVSNAFFHNGRMDSAYLTKTISSSDEATALYNAGVGRMYSELTSANGLGTFQTNLISWWGFNEESGIRYDAKGSNNLNPSSVQLINATTLNGGFETLGAGGADVFADWTENIAGTSTVNAESVAPYAGTYSCRFDVDGSNSLAQVSRNVLTIGRNYKVTFYAKGASGTPAMGIEGIGTHSRTLTTSYVQYSVFGTAVSATLAIKRSAASSNSIFVDNVTVESTGPIFVAGIAAGQAIDGNFCGQFSGSNYLTVASNATLQTGNIDFTAFGWINADQLATALAFPFGKYAAGTNKREWGVFLSSGSNNISFVVSPDGTATGTGTITGGAATPGNWYFIVAKHDSVNNLLKLKINNSSVSDVAYATGITAFDGGFQIGARGDNSTPFPGRIDGVGFIKRLTTDAEDTAMFNVGKGVKYAGLPSTITSDANFISFWEMDKRLGITADSKGSNTLTNVSVTFGQGVNYYEGVVSTILDQSVNSKTLTQVTPSKRPLESLSSIGNQASLLFDGVDDALSNATDLAGIGDITVISVIKPIGFGGGNLGRIIDNSQFLVAVSSAAGTLSVSSVNGATTANSANSSISVNNSYVVAVTRTSAGVVNIYINGSLSGTANQDSGTPVAGSTTYIGNRAAGDRAFDGYIGKDIGIFPSILTLPTIQKYTNVLKSYYGI